ncbi:MAG: hypothetical protein H7Z43_15835, partial [Clostridia bacterium]|nr:hypothetical protein [Deltaproteobacteria bacterium]
MKTLSVFVLLTFAACSNSGLPPVEFPALPTLVTDHARYGIVTLREVNVTMERSVGKVTQPATLTVTELTRAIIKGDAPVALYERDVPDWTGCTVTKASGRRAVKGGSTTTVNAFADENVSHTGVRVAVPKPGSGDAVDFFIEHVCTGSFEQLPPVILGQAMPTLDSRVVVKADSAFKVRLVVSPGADTVTATPQPTRIEKTGIRVWSFRERDLPAHDEDSFALAVQHVSPWIQIVVEQIRDAPTGAESWSAVAAQVRANMKVASPAGTPDADLVATGSAQVRFRKLRDKLAPRSVRLPYAAPR